MFIPAELVYKNYIPDEIVPGMLFVQHLHMNTLKQTIEVFEIDKAPLDSQKFIIENGFPIKLSIVDPFMDVLAENEHIGWFDNPDDDFLESITIKHINTIFNDFDTMLMIEVDDESGDPLLYEGLVSIRYLSTDLYYEDEEYNDESEICVTCNGSGEGMFDGSVCFTCGGSGEIKHENNEI